MALPSILLNHLRIEASNTKKNNQKEQKTFFHIYANRDIYLYREQIMPFSAEKLANFIAYSIKNFRVLFFRTRISSELMLIQSNTSAKIFYENR